MQLTCSKLTSLISKSSYIDDDNEKHDGWDSFMDFVRNCDKGSELKLVTEDGQELLFKGVTSYRHNSSYIVVFKVGEQYFREDCYYDSWNGTTLEGDFYEVVPVEVTKTEYKTKS